MFESINGSNGFTVGFNCIGFSCTKPINLIMQIQNSIYHNIQKLIWTAFIGVVSFQLIAPQVWGYMNKLAGVSYIIGYYIFTIAYIIIVPAIFFYWLHQNREEIRETLSFTETEADNNAAITNTNLFSSAYWPNRYVKRILYIISIQIFICLFLLCFYVSFWLFVIIQYGLLYANIFLLAKSKTITKRYLNQKIQNSGTAGEKTKFERLRSQTAFSFNLFLILIFLWGAFFLYRSNNYSDAKTHPERGFKLLTLKDSLSSYKDGVDTASIFQQIIGPKIDTPKFKQQQIQLETNFAHYWQLITTKFKKEPYHSKVTDDSTINVTKAAVRRLDSLPDQSLLDRRKLLKVYIQAVEDRTKTTAQKLLGVVLRDHQSKMLCTFVDLFFSLLAFYLLLRMKADIDESNLKNSASEKQILSLSKKTVLTDIKSGKLEKLIIEQEKTAKKSLEMADGTWFVVVLTIWLLIPLLKPIEDKSIDTEAPFKILTLSPSISIFESKTWQSGPSTDYTNSFNQQIGSLHTNGNPDTNGKAGATMLNNDTSINGYIKKQFEYIRPKVDSAFNRTGRLDTNTNKLLKQNKDMKQKIDYIEQ